MKIKRTKKNLLILPFIPLYFIFGIFVMLLECIGDIGNFLSNNVFPVLPKLDCDWQDDIDKANTEFKDRFFSQTQKKTTEIKKEN